jgi:hypothetical protein
MDRKALTCVILITGAVVVSATVYCFTAIRNSNDLHRVAGQTHNIMPILPNANSDLTSSDDGPSDSILGHTRAYWMREYPEAGITKEMSDREATRRILKAKAADARNQVDDALKDSWPSPSQQSPIGQGQ